MCFGHFSSNHTSGDGNTPLLTVTQPFSFQEQKKNISERGGVADRPQRQSPQQMPGTSSSARRRSDLHSLLPGHTCEGNLGRKKEQDG